MALLSSAIVLATLWLAGGIPAPPATPTCTCVEAQELNGWCHVHELGYIASVPIRSDLLFELLDAHGHAIEGATFYCPSCLRAIEEEGFCEADRIGFVRGMAYFSRLTYELARGDRVRPESLACPVCRRNSQSHGWCDACRRGMAGHVATRDRPSYEAVVDALEILALANAAAERCEHCAMAIVTDNDCPFCRIKYKDGEPLPAPPIENGQGDRR